MKKIAALTVFTLMAFWSYAQVPWINSISETNTSCVGGCTGVIEIDAGSMNPPEQYSIDGGATFQSSNLFLGVCPGAYSVVVQDNMAQQVTGSATILDGTGPTMTAMTINNVTCFNGVDGAIYQTVSGGTPPLTFYGTDNAASPNLTNVGYGSYSLQVWDANGCTVTNNYNLTQPDEVIASLLWTNDVNCFGGSDGGINTDATGGDGNYTYTWDSGDAGSLISGLSAGDYTLTVSDGLGCTGQYGPISIIEPDEIIVTTSAYDVQCHGELTGEAYTSTTGGDYNYNYIWSNGDGSSDLYGIGAGTYTVTVTDGSGCSGGTTSVIVSEPDTILATVSQIAPITCPGGQDGELLVIASGGTGVLSYYWINDGATTTTSSSGADGYNGVDITDQVGCQITAGVNLVSPQNIFATFTKTDLNCNGVCDGTITANITGGTGAYSYLWDDSNSQTTATAVGLCETEFSGLMYTLTITDGNGCVQQSEPDLGGVWISEPDTLEVSVSSVNATCSNANGSAVASPTGGTLPYVSTIWSSGGTALTETGLANGTYAFDVIDANGCLASDTAYVELDVIPVDICVVTVDSTSTKNVLVWTKPIATGISHFNIYRDIVGTYTYVASVPYDSLSQFVDNSGGVNPQVTQYRYEISVVDSCGNESDLSSFHQTIHLNAPNLVGNTADLVWQAYAGFTSNYYYRIIRDTTLTNNWEAIDSVSSTTLVYTDIAVPSTANIRYEVQIAFTNTCSATKAQDHNTTRSNRASIAGPGTGINEVFGSSIKVNPNPTSGKFNINLGRNHSESLVELFDVQGKLIATKIVGANSMAEQFDISSYERGMYLIKVSSDKGIETIRIIKQQ